MKRQTALITLLSLLLNAYPVFALDGAELASFNAGKPIVREVIDKVNNKSETQLVFLIKSTPTKIWDTLIDYEHYPEFMPIQQIKVKSRHKGYDIVFIKPESPPLVNISYDLKRTYFKDDWKIVFIKVAGNIKSIDGYWKLDPIDAKSTKVTYVTNVDIGMPVPGFVKDYFAKGSLYKMADSVKKRVESSGKWKR